MENFKHQFTTRKHFICSIKVISWHGIEILKCMKIQQLFFRKYVSIYKNAYVHKRWLRKISRFQIFWIDSLCLCCALGGLYGISMLRIYFSSLFPKTQNHCSIESAHCSTEKIRWNLFTLTISNEYCTKPKNLHCKVGKFLYTFTKGDLI